MQAGDTAWWLVTQTPANKPQAGPIVFFASANFAILSGWQQAQGLNPSTTLWFWNGAAWSFYATYVSGQSRPNV